MTYITVPTDWVDVNFDNIVKNWTQTASGTFVRKSNSYLPIQGLAHATNHILARNPRVIFQKAWRLGDVDKTGIDPLCRWLYDDTVDNARSYRVRIYYFSREGGTNDSQVTQWSGATEYDSGNETSPDMTGNDTGETAVEWTNLKYADYIVSRGNKNDAEITDGITTNNGIIVVAIVVEDLPLSQLDSTNHIYCSPGLAKKGGIVKEDPQEEIATGIHAAFKGNPSIVGSWVGMGSTATSNGQYVRTVSTTTYRNIFDTTIAGTPGSDPDTDGIRTGNTPGFCWNGYQWGRAPNPFTTVKIHVRVLARSTGVSNTYVWFQGPDHVSGNYNMITIPAASSIGWFGNGYVWNNGTVGYDESSTSRNKVDVFGRLANPSDRLYIYGIRAWAELT